MALTDFTYYANRNIGGVGAEEIDSDRARTMLSELQKYDPNAYFRPTYGGEGNLIGYTLDYNASKLPGLDGGLLHSTATGGDSGGNYLPRFSTVQDQMQLVDPNAVRNSDIYGKVTDNTNLANPATTMDWLAPLLVGGFGLAMGGMPAIYEGVFGQGAYGAGADLSGLGASDPFLQGGTGAMDTMGSYGTGVPGSLGSNLGGAESSLYGADVLNNPAGALGGGSPVGGLTQAQWDEIIAGQPENGSFVGPDGTDPNGFTPGDYTDLADFNAGLDSPDWLSRIGDVFKNLPQGLLGGAPSGGGGGGLLAMGNKPQLQYEDLTKILGRFYGARHG